MKKLCSSFAVLFLATLNAQPQGGSAYLGFMNAVGLSTKTDVRVDGNSVKPAGFPEGNYIESFGLPMGGHQFVFANADCTPLTQAIQITGPPAPLYILYNIPVPQPGGRVKQTLRLLTIPGQSPAQRQRHFLAVYASARPSATITINGSQVSLPSGRPTPLNAASLDVSVGAETLKHYAPSRPGNYLLVLFDGSDGGLHQRLLQME